MLCILIACLPLVGVYAPGNVKLKPENLGLAQVKIFDLCKEKYNLWKTASTM
jgi:hypothetical protein